jgi:hypothetical protein
MNGRDGASDLAPYAALVRLAEFSLRLAREQRYDEIAQLEQQRAQIVRELPAKPPHDARELLARALQLQRRMSTDLISRREQVVLALRRIELSKRAARGYGQSVAGRRSERVQAKA